MQVWFVGDFFSVGVRVFLGFGLVFFFCLFVYLFSFVYNYIVFSALAIVIFITLGFFPVKIDSCQQFIHLYTPVAYFVS